MKFGIYTLGCKVNTYESEYVKNLLLNHDFIESDFNDICDIYIINTCTVTNTSDIKSRKIIRQARRRNKDACIIAMGCFIQADDNNIIDDIDIAVGNNDKSRIAELINEFFKDKKKILGVCLGFQAIAKYFGADILKANEPTHGLTSKIFFKPDEKLFYGFKQGFSATRYHSLIVKNIEKSKGKIQKTAWLKDDTLMGLRVGENIVGVQFHPEAILTQNGIEIFKNFLSM